MDIARRFGAPAPARSGAPGPAETGAVLSGCPPDAGAYGMRFAPYVSVPRLSLPLAPPRVDCAQWQWARLPRFPGTPVIPTVVSGLGLEWRSPIAAHRAAAPPPPVASAAPYISAAASFLAWLYTAPAEAILRAAGFIPVSAAKGVQGPFWARASKEVRALGDYANFANYADGWPGVPPTDYVGQALAKAVQRPSSLPSLLGRAETRANAWLTSTAAGHP